MYVVKETFLTLQGEGAQVGRTAVMCRMAGCNLWTGRELDRSAAGCRFCDTDFLGTDGPGGGRFVCAADLARHILGVWESGVVKGRPYAVFTGGEPLLQVDEALVRACHDTGFVVGLETNGTLPAPPGLDWVCVSPKAGAPLTLTHGDELKLVFPQEGLEPDAMVDLPFTHHFLQPCDGPDRAANIAAAIAWCLRDARWRLSLQTHKLTGIP